MALPRAPHLCPCSEMTAGTSLQQHYYGDLPPASSLQLGPRDPVPAPFSLQGFTSSDVFMRHGHSPSPHDPVRRHRTNGNAPESPPLRESRLLDPGESCTKLRAIEPPLPIPTPADSDSDSELRILQDNRAPSWAPIERPFLRPRAPRSSLRGDLAAIRAPIEPQLREYADSNLQPLLESSSASKSFAQVGKRHQNDLPQTGSVLLLCFALLAPALAPRFVSSASVIQIAHAASSNGERKPLKCQRAGFLRHNFNNPIAAIFTHLHYLSSVWFFLSRRCPATLE
ncbi:hypothetical protein DFH09DRAFT_1330326 [Mycena vulgaris]|nr:hypothetical protein DFH09DRAFT_1330326 [Mycena vulgaris]